MTANQIKERRTANPFVPFTLRLANGRRFFVPHRDFISQSPGGRIVIVYGTDDAASIVDLYLVTDLEVHAAATDTGSGAS
jgi:hypothetical protein